MKKIGNKNFLMMLTPICYYSMRFHFEPNVLRESNAVYIYSNCYPTMYPSNKYGIENRILGDAPAFDEVGIPIVRNKNESYYNPVMIAQYGLLEYGFYLNIKNECNINKAILCGRWLMDHCTDGAIYYEIDYQMKLPKIHIKQPFISAMSQGQALSLWVRLYTVTGDANWLSLCEKVAIKIATPIDEGGTMTDFDGYKWYEEYPTNPGTHVLNGFLFCLIGLYDAFTVTKSRIIEEIYNDGFATLEKKLPQFDNGYLSIYHLGHMEYPCNEVCISPSYHVIHVKLLEALYAISKSSIIEYYISKWK